MRRNWLSESTVSFNYPEWIKKVEEEQRRKRGEYKPSGILDSYEFILGEGVKLSDDANAICDRFLCANPDVDVLYADEDELGPDGKRQNPFFKPEFSPERLLCQDYISDFCLVRKGLNPNGLKGYELALHLLDVTENIRHVQAILSHREPPQFGGHLPNPSTAYSGPPPLTGEDRTGDEEKRKYIERNGISGYVEAILDTDLSRIVYDTQGEPLVSVIIPSKDHPELLERVISGLRGNTDYQNFEIIIVDNGSSEENKSRIQAMCLELNKIEINKKRKVKYLYGSYDFNFSKMCNTGANTAAGEYILLLNDDIEIPTDSANWLSRMLGQAMQPGVGAVGAKLYYPGGKLIQHDGVTSIFPGVAHFICRHDDNEVLPNAENRIDREAIAVTAACLLVKKTVYEEVDGFNENLAVAFNDVEFCFKLLRAGYRNILRNDAILIHHESISRGDDLKNKAKKDRMLKERKILFEAFPEYNGYDPYRNPMLNQFEPDVSYNYFITENTECMPVLKDYRSGSKYAVKMVMDVFKLSGRIMIAGSCIFILNDASPLKILLEGRSGMSFEISAKRFYRPEIRKKYPPYPYIEYGSFRAVADIEALPKDEYEIFLVRHGKKYKAPCKKLKV